MKPVHRTGDHRHAAVGASGLGPTAASLAAVFFDLGETLIDESTEYGAWADWLDVPRHTFSAVFGAVLANGDDYRQVFEKLRPGFDLKTERQKRLDAGLGESFNARDLYPDARPGLQALRAAGYFVGIAGNQTRRAGKFIRELNLPADLITTSDDLGTEKPDTAFFEKLIEISEFEPQQILYVGDRLDNDVRPAKQVGMRTAFIRRGPWAYAFPLTPENVGPDIVIHSLLELAPILGPGRIDPQAP